MAIYRCNGCDRLVDDDYEPGTTDPESNYDSMLCEACAETLPRCTDCGEVCKTIEETFDYAGTHCNHGIAGTHRTGHYISKCCHAELEE